MTTGPARSVKQRPLGVSRRLDVGQLQHPERVGEAAYAREDRDQKGELKRALGRVVVDLEDLFADGRRFARELVLELALADDLGIVLELVGDLLLAARGD